MSLGNSKTAGILSAYVASGSSIKDCSVDTGGNTIRFGNTVAVAGAIAAATEGEISGTGLYGGGVIRAVRSGNAQVKFGGFTAENKGPSQILTYRESMWRRKPITAMPQASLHTIPG